MDKLLIYEPKIAILLVLYLGEPETPYSAVNNSEIRYEYTKNSYILMREDLKNTEIYIGMVGDINECKKFQNECRISEEKCHWFEQDQALFKYGTGALENKLILNSIKFWSLDTRYEKIIKITAKYYISNITKIINYCKYINSPIYGWKIPFKQMVDSRLLIFCPKFYIEQQFILQGICTTFGSWMENKVYRIMKDNRFIPGYLAFRPIYYGYSGTSGKIDQSNNIKKIVIKIASKIKIIQLSLNLLK